MDSEEERSKDGSLQEKCSFPDLVLKLAQKKIVKFVTKLYFSEACFAVTIIFFFSFTVLFEETKPGCLILDGTHHIFDIKLP